MKQVSAELQKKLVDAERENDALLENLERKEEYIQQLDKENQRLRQQLQTADASVQPDHEAIRDRTLDKLKTGRQSTAGKAIEAFIKELKRQ
ncbi:MULTISPECIES: hypothetical protein [unclassified Tolypothrix]|uniref:hypothetical protein n=1 Tax=unclassified Tolypothrix TaxID=2649714 RepID=UPI0005EAC341|nr:MULTISPECIES: hypothetical protein [unclassified Tolypothrix]BAY90787.1 hypothetical protein NIES3275_28040 [Microchaete diplosiphon NIES-3275]EKF04366.1 hypothetical protein FDUTEX481_02045 [Tolypothrix sp. PCC 7601]MBE9081013.1 hypothetical protein [Tolypothrix sp. LEGE 11397]UYD24920.1 hypothetical protein HGR01_26415 [Tolypothrix sp. PCC 7712]UYD32847.1 hypothetical protein HG267_28220 [Tolypothrix sp. PCC 7601]